MSVYDELKVYNQSGVEVTAKVDIMTETDGVWTLKVSHLERGMYTIKQHLSDDTENTYNFVKM